MKGTILSFLVVVCLTTVVRGQGQDLPTDPLSGRLVFEAKGCLNCHSLSGYGGDHGPDLARDRFFGNAAELAAVMWNHVPAMIRSHRKLGATWESFSESEMRELMGFLYYLRYLGEPGSTLRGKTLVDEKGCTSCHGASVQPPVSVSAPAFTDLGIDVSPVGLVQAMWNHGPAMMQRVTESNTEYPLLGPGDINDISAYLQMAAHGEGRSRMAPGNPSHGKVVFEDKNCQSCHAVSPGTTSDGPNLYAQDLRSSVTEIAGLMWNHAPLMYRQMKTEQVAWPDFTGSEMADLIAYLYFLGFEDNQGDAASGRLVFEEKRCIDCHGAKATGSAPDLLKGPRPNSLMDLSARMWNHAPEMEEVVLTRNMSWPEMTGDEVSDLFEYLHSHEQTDETGGPKIKER